MSAFLNWLAQRKKAALGFVTPGVALFAADWAQTGNLPTAHQWETIGVTCVLTAFGVHQIGNDQASEDGPTGMGSRRA